MKTFNKKGDFGETSLLFGSRVSKDDLHCEAYGTIDEAVSLIGLARSLCSKNKTRQILFQMQKDLFIVGAELATPVTEHDRLLKQFEMINDDKVAALEKDIVELENEIEMPRSFIIPGDNTASAVIDVARATLRRAERRAVELKRQSLLVNENILKFLNRAADLLFTLARYESR